MNTKLSRAGLFVSCIFGLCWTSAALGVYQIPAERTVQWEGNVGVENDIPIRTTACVTLSPSGGDDAPAIQNAIASCPSGQVVRLNAGTFKVGKAITVKSDITLRGAGIGLTVIQGTSGMSGAYVLGMSAGVTQSSATSLTGGLGKGSTTLSTGSPHGWRVGDIILIDQLNNAGDNPMISNSGNNGTCTWCGRTSGSRSLGQMNRVVAVPTSTTATLEIPLYWNFDPALRPEAVRIGGITSKAGIEDLSVDNELSGSVNQIDNGGTIVMRGVSNCWLLRVEAIGSYQNLVHLYLAYRSTIRSSKFHEGVPALPYAAPQYGPSRAYGVRLDYAASASLIENNQIYHLDPGIILNGAISGNVMAYNYITELRFTGTWQGGAIQYHGAHAMMNLMEGNYYAGRLTPDHVWGTSSHNTSFRNRQIITPGATGATWNVDLHFGQQYYNIIGNVMGTPGVENTYELQNVTLNGEKSIYRFGYDGDGDGSPTGNDPQVAATVLRHANWDSVHKGVVWNGSDDHSLPASLYLASKPAWMGTALPWPPIGPDVVPMYPEEPGAGNGTPFDANEVASNNDGKTSSNVWQNMPFQSQAGLFTATFDMLANAANIDGLSALSAVPIQSFTDQAVIVRFNPSGTIDARNGSNYAAANTIPYVPNKVYHVRLKVDVPNRKYDAYITPDGQTEILLASGFGFRTEQASVSVLQNAGIFADIGTHEVTNFSISQGFTILASAGPDGAISPSGSVSVSSGASQTFTLSPATGYKVADLTVDGHSVGAVSSYAFSNITANHSIAASFVALPPVVFTVTASAGSGGSITPSGVISVNANGSRTFSIVPLAGLRISDVLVDGTSVGAVNSYTFSTVGANHTISAVFAPLYFTITSSTGSGGTISPSGSRQVQMGSAQAFTITPSTGYQIGAVTVDGGSVGVVSTYTFTNVIANHGITATFVPITYAIKATSGAGGTVSPAGTSTVNQGASQTYTMTPATGYKISDVLVDGLSVGAVNSYVFSGVNASHTISASFAALPPVVYTVTASSGAGGQITPSGVSAVTASGSLALQITPSTGFRISDVLVDGASVGPVSSYSFASVGANHTISASFVATAQNSFAVNAGGPRFLNSRGVLFQADTDYSGGNIGTTTVLPAGASDGFLYQTERYGNFSYKFPVVNGNYTVSLKFVEMYWSATGKRIFNVAINGVPVIGNLDIFSKVGKNVPYDVSIPVSVTNSSGLTITFGAVVDNAQVSAIEVEPRVFTVNAGGPLQVSPTGATFQADVNYSGGSVANTGAVITGTSEPAVYQSERYGNFSYNIPVTNGSYNVVLKFAEIYFSMPGQRVFSVQINGTTVISNLDLYAKVGKNAAYDVSVPVTVTSGSLNIKFVSQVNNAKVSAIVISQQTASASPLPTVTPTPSPSATATPTATVTPSPTASGTNAYAIHIDSVAHQKFGLTYPVTYKFRIPAGSTQLKAQYGYTPDTWTTFIEKKSTDSFNGIEAARFDYSNLYAYLSVRFSRSSDDIYLRVLNSAGQAVILTFDSIPKYYDQRSMAATVELDDWAAWSDPFFKPAVNYLGQLGLYFSVGLITKDVPWSSVQSAIDQWSDRMEIASHSVYHSSSSAEYAANGYQTEVTSSRDAIRAKLIFASSPFVPVFIEPGSYTDSTLESTISSANYLVSIGSDGGVMSFAPWDSNQGRYPRVGLTFSDFSYSDNSSLLSNANAAFNKALSAGGIYHLLDHPHRGLFHDGSYLLQHLAYIGGRTNVWYAPLGSLYQYHFVQEMRGNLTVQRR